MTDVVGGQVPVIFDALGPAIAFVKAGKVRPLAVTSAAKRSPSLPDVPTLAESGLTEMDLVTWIGFVAPAGTDRSRHCSVASSKLARKPWPAPTAA
jgi:tripartite-type tricarboxylate transporter receptor subunit TctC